MKLYKYLIIIKKKNLAEKSGLSIKSIEQIHNHVYFLPIQKIYIKNAITQNTWLEPVLIYITTFSRLSGVI